MSLPVRVKLGQADGGELKAQTRDVSYRGLYFRTEAKLDGGSEIDFVLTLPQQIITAGDVDIRCHGCVVRVDHGENGTHGIAARIDRYEFIPSRSSAN
ncbi:MAG: PilZ domain-containing protein [Acidobacteriota bacterium]|nr:PilZ domain-containing protein [Acidobacteriota bacterium]